MDIVQEDEEPPFEEPYEPTDNEVLEMFLGDMGIDPKSIPPLSNGFDNTSDNSSAPVGAGNPVILENSAKIRRSKRAEAQRMKNMALKMRRLKDVSLVSDVLAKGETTIFYGNPGCGKSFVAIDISMSIVNGRDWQHRRQGKGVFYTFVEKWKLVFSKECLLGICDMRHQRKLQKGLNDCAVLILHHATKGEQGGIRGSSALLGTVDVVYQISMDESSGTITMKNEKARNSEPKRFTLKLDEQYITYEYTQDDDQIGLKTVKSAVPVMTGSGELQETKSEAVPKEKPQTKVEVAKTIIMNLLESSSGEVLAVDVFAACKDADISENTVRRAKSELNLGVRQDKNGWVWIADVV